MRVALVALDPDTAQQVGGWLGDEGHLPRRYASAERLIASDHRDQYTVVITTPEAVAAIGESAEVDCQLIVIGEDSPAGDVVLRPPLRRRALLKALAAS